MTIATLIDAVSAEMREASKPMSAILLQALRESPLFRGMTIYNVCHAINIPVPTCEFRHIPGRRFRLDYAWPDYRIGMEVQGGIWTSGKHSRGTGQKADMEKNNLGILNGWRVFLCVPGKEAQTIVECIKPAIIISTTKRTP